MKNLLRHSCIALFLAGLAALFLAGCGIGEDGADSPGQAEVLQGGQEPGGMRLGSMIQEDENYLYVCGAYRVLKIDKETKESEILWENAEMAQEQEEYLYSRGNGLLAGGMLYFVEYWQSEDGVADGVADRKSLSVIRTDGTDYARIGEISLLGDDSMILKEGVLYVDSDNRLAAYQIAGAENQVAGSGESAQKEQGADNEEPAQKEQGADNEEPVQKEQGAGNEEPVQKEQDAGSGESAQKEQDAGSARDAGFLQDTEYADIWEVLGYPEGSSYYLTGYREGRFYNSAYYLTEEYQDVRVVYLVDRETLEKKEFARLSGNGGAAVIAMDEEYVYIQEQAPGDDRNYIYKKLSLADGEESVVFERKESYSRFLSPRYLMDIVLCNGYLYYAGDKDYRFYVMRRSLEDPSREELLGDAFYDSGIGAVGNLAARHEQVYSRKNPDILLFEADLEWLQVDERFAGAEEINQYLASLQEEALESYKKEAFECLEDEIEGDYAPFISWSYDSSLPEITYFDGIGSSDGLGGSDGIGGSDGLGGSGGIGSSDGLGGSGGIGSSDGLGGSGSIGSSDGTGGRYLSFCQQEYEYMGGAHGMPYWIGFTFDLETGKRLALKDIIKNNERELKDIVTAWFGAVIDAEPENYWTDARETVQNSTSFDSAFYLTEEGICFYFGPYALACYAAGFQKVTIPYEEFDLKIPVGRTASRGDGAQGTAGIQGASGVQGAAGAQGTSGTQGAAGAGPDAPQTDIEKPELALASEDWGLSFGEEGTQPRGNASAEALKWYDAYYVGDEGGKVIYLTFDCGYENGNTEPILDALKKHDAPGTFFVVGHFLETAPEMAKRMVEEGHAVGNHTYHHPDMAAVSQLEDFQKELDDVAQLFHEVTGADLSPYYRPPQGKCNEANLEMAKELGYSTIFWSLAHVDWIQDKQPGRKESIDKLTKRIHPGAVVLLHNTSQTNGEILDELLTKWEEMGYTFRPLSDLAGQ